MKILFKALDWLFYRNGEYLPKPLAKLRAWTWRYGYGRKDLSEH